MNWAKASLFLSGLFFGGAIDHVILALTQRTATPYGVKVGIVGNWVLAAVDLIMTAALYLLHRRFDATLHQPRRNR